MLSAEFSESKTGIISGPRKTSADDVKVHGVRMRMSWSTLSGMHIDVLQNLHEESIDVL